MAKKTISGARAKRGQNSNGCNPRHNNRDYLPSNADPNRQHLNIHFAESTQGVTIEQIYDKLFQESYEEWLRKEHDKGRQKDAPEKYLDKIRDSGDKKREQYEIIWQLGDCKNTGWKTNRVDFMRARQLLKDFAEYLLSQPNITVVTPERLADPTWKPPFEDGLVVTNLALHGDEKTPQMHMDFIPYCRSKTRGQRVQNAYAAAFEGMGYKVVEEQVCDPNTGELLYKKDKDGNFLRDKKGARIPVKQKISFGSIDWIEEQKGWLQKEMDARYGWEREYKGKNKFGDVTMSEFVAEDNLRQARDAEQRLRAAQKQTAAAVAAKERAESEESEAQEMTDGLERIMQQQTVEMLDKRAQIDELDERIDAAHSTLALIEDYESYCETAVTVEQNLDFCERTLQMLPTPYGIFHQTQEQRDWLQDMRALISSMLAAIWEGIKRLLIHESRYGVPGPKRRSEAAQERAEALEDKMSDAFVRTMGSPSDGHQRQREEKY